MNRHPEWLHSTRTKSLIRVEAIYLE